MIWQKLKITDWQRVADFCVQFFWRHSGWAVLLILFAPISLRVVLEPISQLSSQIVIGILLIGLASFVIVGVFGLLLSLWYMLCLKYRYRKSTPIKVLITCLMMIGMYAWGMTQLKKRFVLVHTVHFIQTSKTIFEQLNANSASTQTADAQIKQLIETYNSSNNTLKVTRILTHSAQIYSTTSDREGLGHPVVQFQLRKQRDGRLFWQCQVVRAGTIDSAKLMWCAPDASYGSNART